MIGKAVEMEVEVEGAVGGGEKGEERALVIASEEEVGVRSTGAAKASLSDPLNGLTGKEELTDFADKRTKWPLDEV